MEDTRQKMQIVGGVRLRGEVDACGSKNAALAIIPATILCSEPCTIENIPLIEDIWALCDILRDLGARVKVEGRSLWVDPTSVNKLSVPEDLAGRLRASYYFVGVLLGRYGEGEAAYPGGCDIGTRPIDLHVKSFEALGAKVNTDYGKFAAKAKKAKLIGTEIFLDFASVGATINTMLAAVLAEGTTIISNAAKEPHIVDLANFLNAMGARIKGAGTDTIRIQGVNRLFGSTYTIIPDQIECGTLMIAAAATQGDVLIRGAIPTHMEALSAKLLEMGARVEEGTVEDTIRVRSEGRLRRVNVKTLSYPGFPTDLQQPISALLSCADGVSYITETIFEMRFKHLDEIRRMGGKSRVSDRLAIIEGVPRLTGCLVTATDLRAGAALVIAGLMAEGRTDIENVHLIDRGYESIEERLCILGADIKRVGDAPQAALSLHLGK